MERIAPRKLVKNSTVVGEARTAKVSNRRRQLRCQSCGKHLSPELLNNIKKPSNTFRFDTLCGECRERRKRILLQCQSCGNVPEIGTDPKERCNACPLAPFYYCITEEALKETGSTAESTQVL